MSAKTDKNIFIKKTFCTGMISDEDFEVYDRFEASMRPNLDQASKSASSDQSGER